MPQRIIAGTPLEFFRNALTDALARERVSVTPPAEYYVVHLLVRQIDQGVHPDETLGDRFARAHHEAPAVRVQQLRAVGDSALVFCGLWWEHQYRPLRPSYATYHMDLGRVAYRNIGGQPFDELAAKFSALVDALIRLGTEHSLATARDIVRLYTLWQETDSRYAARALADLGLVPVRTHDSAPS